MLVTCVARHDTLPYGPGGEIFIVRY